MKPVDVVLQISCLRIWFATEITLKIFVAFMYSFDMDF